ncbi:uncharacterized protein [Miscanthus floridulus]|uniref:uncharacterized protein n=1 Tax=Miscanthus floridulus TaxID=154761 RepID=UPI00345ABB76
MTLEEKRASKETREKTRVQIHVLNEHVVVLYVRIGCSEKHAAEVARARNEKKKLDEHRSRTDRTAEEANDDTGRLSELIALAEAGLQAEEDDDAFFTLAAGDGAGGGTRRAQRGRLDGRGRDGLARSRPAVGGDTVTVTAPARRGMTKATAGASGTSSEARARLGVGVGNGEGTGAAREAGAGTTRVGGRAR